MGSLLSLAAPLVCGACKDWAALPFSLPPPLLAGSGGAQRLGPRKTEHESQLCPLLLDHSPLLSVSFSHLQNRDMIHHTGCFTSQCRNGGEKLSTEPKHSTSSIHGISDSRLCTRTATGRPVRLRCPEDHRGSQLLPRRRLSRLLGPLLAYVPAGIGPSESVMFSCICYGLC